MKFLIWMLVFLIIPYTSFGNSENFQKKEYADAVDVVQEIIAMEAPIVPMYQNDEACIFTSFPVEEAIRDYAQYHQGGTDRHAIARALDDLSVALSIIINIDTSQPITYDEIHDFVVQTSDSNGLDVLLCLAIAYKKIPRK